MGSTPTASTTAPLARSPKSQVEGPKSLAEGPWGRHLCSSGSPATMEAPAGRHIPASRRTPSGLTPRLQTAWPRVDPRSRGVPAGTKTRNSAHSNRLRFTCLCSFVACTDVPQIELGQMDSTPTAPPARSPRRPGQRPNLDSIGRAVLPRSRDSAAILSCPLRSFHPKPRTSPFGVAPLADSEKGRNCTGCRRGSAKTRGNSQRDGLQMSIV